MNIEFNDLPWHDAEILSIFIDRKKAGEQDTVMLSMRWPDGTESIVAFSECYAFNALMNFGVVAPETVLNVNAIGCSEDLDIIRQRWRVVGVNLDALICFQIKTNSTSSTIQIFALEFSVL